MSFKHLLAAALAASALSPACNSNDRASDSRTQELVQARLDAEKVKELQKENSDLRGDLDKLRQENEALKVTVAKLEERGDLRTASKAAAAKPKAPAAAARGAPENRAPASDKEGLHNAVTGGGSFK